MCMSGGGSSKPQEIVMEKLPDAPGSPAELAALQATSFNGSSPDEIASASAGLDTAIADRQAAIAANEAELAKINYQLGAGKFNRKAFLDQHAGLKAKIAAGKKIDVRARYMAEIASGKLKIPTKQQANKLKATRNSLAANNTSLAIESQQIQATKANQITLNQLGAAENTVAARGRDSLRIDRGTP